MNKQVNVVISKIREAARKVHCSQANLRASKFLKENKVSIAESIAESFLAYGDAAGYLISDYKSAKSELQKHKEQVSADELAAVNDIIQSMSNDLDNVRLANSHWDSAQVAN